MLGRWLLIINYLDGRGYHHFLCCRIADGFDLCVRILRAATEMISSQLNVAFVSVILKMKTQYTVPIYNIC